MRACFQTIDDFLRGRGEFAIDASLAHRLRWFLLLIVASGVFYGAVMGTYSGLAPFTVVWYVSSTDYPSAILFNAVMFGVATAAAQVVVRRYYGPLIRRSSRHRLLLRFWFVLYAFVGIQMAWVLRPFIGDPHQPVEFFRSGAWGNAYVVLAHLIVRVTGRWDVEPMFRRWLACSVLPLALILASFYVYHVLREKHLVKAQQNHHHG